MPAQMCHCHDMEEEIYWEEGHGETGLMAYAQECYRTERKYI